MAKSDVDIRTHVTGENKITRLAQKLKRLEMATKGYATKSGRNLEATNQKWKKHFDALDKGIQMFGKLLTGMVTKGAKFAALQIAVLGGAMMALHASFVVGNAAMKAFRWLAKGAAGAAAGLAVAAGTAAAAIREQQIAMFAFKGGKNYQNASVLMRQLAADAEFAAVGAEGVQAAFSAISKTSTFTAGSANLLKGLLDFAAAGKPLEEGIKAAGNFVAQLQNPKATFSQIKEAAKELGPEMEKALEEAGKKGVDTADEVRKAILDGTLSAAGEVTGQFEAVNGTLISRFKSQFGLIKNMFADFGEPFLEPVKQVFDDVVRIFKRTFNRISGEIMLFANGKFFEDIVTVTDKLGNWFVNFMRKYLPAIQGMFSSIGDWWKNFKDGWNRILDKLRPLIEGARILEETLMRIFRPIGEMFKEGFGDVNEMFIQNEDKFYAFGDAIGDFIVVISKFAKTVREIFVDALPFLTKAIEGLTTLVDLFLSLLGGFRSLMGGSGFGSFALLTTMLAGGRAMKKTKGGFVTTFDMQAQKSGKSGRQTGQTPGGNVSDAGAARAKAVSQAVSRQQVASMTVGNMVVSNSMGAGAAGGMSSRSSRLSPAEQAAKREAMRAQRLQGINAAKQQSMLMPGGNIRYKTLSGMDAQMKNTWLNRNFRLPANARQQLTVDPNYYGPGRYFRDMRQQVFRQPRESYAYKRMFGGEVGTPGTAGHRQFKGVNNSFGAGMAASLGMGLLANVMPQESQWAMALGSAVGAFNPLAGLAIGVVGGLIMGIRGAAKRRKKESIAEAKKQGEDFMKQQIDGFQEGMKKLREEGTYSKAREKEGRQKIIDNYSTKLAEIDSLIMGNLNARGRMSLAAGQSGENVPFVREASNAADLARLDLEGYDIMDAEAVKAVAKQQRLTGTGLFGGMTDEQYKEATKDIEAFIAAQREQMEMNKVATETLFEFGDQRMSELSRVMGKSEEEIRQMADTIGVNLYDATQTTTEQLKLMAKAMIDTSKELYDRTADIYAEGTSVFNKKIEQIESEQALTQGAFGIRGQLNEYLGGTMGEKDIKAGLLTYFQDTMSQLTAYYQGDVQLALEEFTNRFGPNGAVWDQIDKDGNDGPFRGMRETVMNIVGSELTEAIDTMRTDYASALGEYTRSNVMLGGAQLGGDVEGLMALLTTGDRKDLQQLISTTDLSSDIGRNSLMNFLETIPGAEEFGITIAPYLEPQLEAAQKLESAAKAFADRGVPNFQAATQGVIDALGGDGDTSSPIGDRLGSTLASHSALNSSIPGKRTITSGYRNYALGSLNSDHVTGRALDITGQNLVSYRNNMMKSGGFAEFHGKGDSRHLHVVPPRTPAMGDSMTAVSATSASVSAGAKGTQTISNTNNFYISGTNAQEIADQVIMKIQRVNKSNSERR
jgi:plasmid maintenance system killer protein